MDVSVFWFRRDLRLHDNAGLYHALKSGKPVVPIFIFDTNILDELEDRFDKRVDFIHRSLANIQKQLVAMGSTLHVLYGTPLDCYKKLTGIYNIHAVYTNHDYEPYAKEREQLIADYLLAQNIPLYTYKDQVLFEKDEVVKDNGEPYTVYTPYSKKVKIKLNDFYLKSYPTEKYFNNFYKQPPVSLPTLSDMSFLETDLDIVSPTLNTNIAKKYHETRDIPGILGTTRLSVHLRFGTVSIRQLASEAAPISEKLLNELIWRDFYQMILWQFPRVVNQAFHIEYDNIKWRNNEEEFEKWCNGQTGYPIVDAGMRELNQTGYMHNRVRMVVASFLTKHLLIDWRWGEAYFAKKLLDFDLASNNGGWQWAAGSGCDAAPYFRIFNPYLQTTKFDPDFAYIKKWVPEFQEFSYPKPIVVHEDARDRCLKVYKAALADKMKIER
ncbi:deoxyribodipyrimidine photolyase [Chitinophagaceae bacterium IBVUCB1]|nr:deoxyribodipyrimidine photolyase [Chitinophagaceae bacterium IBVUCB1]